MALKPEQLEQIKLFEWLKLNSKTKNCCFAIPNDGARLPRLGALMKRLGLKPGVSDIFIARPNNHCHGLFIELKAKDSKTGKYRKPSETQIEFLLEMNKMGYLCIVANGADEAIEIVEQYLNNVPRETFSIPLYAE